MIRKIRQALCRHVFRKRVIPNGFRVVDGWLVQAYCYRCARCGKKIYESEREKWL